MHGGKRKDAGRKPIPIKMKRKQICITLSRDNIDFLMSINNRSKFIEKLIKKYREEDEKIYEEFEEKMLMIADKAIKKLITNHKE